MTTLNARSYSAGKFLWEVDGVPVGFLESFSGGDAAGEVATHNTGPTNYATKNITTVGWSPCKVRTGMGMSKGLYEWIQAAFDMGVMYKTGCIHSANFNYKVERSMDMENMLMTKVSMPKLEGKSKASGYFDIEFRPEKCRWRKGGGEDLRGQIGPKQKAWAPANFRFECAGLPTQRVSEVEGISWECKTATDPIGDGREYTIHPTATSVADFKIKVSARDLEAFQQKAHDWFITGNCLQQHEMTAAVTLLAQDMTTVLGTIELLGVGLKKLDAYGQLKGQSEDIASFTAEFYAEHIKLNMQVVDA